MQVWANGTEPKNPAKRAPMQESYDGRKNEEAE